MKNQELSSPEQNAKEKQGKIILFNSKFEQRDISKFKVINLTRSYLGATGKLFV